MKLIGATIHTAAATGSAQKKHDWLKEQWQFDDVMDAIVHVLLSFGQAAIAGGVRSS